MRGADKKTRADNFSEEDKGLLLSLIADHVAVLECRKTDHKNNSAKYKAWAAISKKFHRQASHPRNFTQMKDLYRRLKLKAKKEVGPWLKACAESGSGMPLPGSQVIQPDDTSFLVYEMIKPYKEELCPDDEKQEMILAAALKNRDLSEAFLVKPAADDENEGEENVVEEPILKSEPGECEISDEETDASSEMRVKEEPDFEYVPPSIAKVATEVASEVPEAPPRTERSCIKRTAENHQSTPPSTFTNPFRRPNRSHELDPMAKRRRTFPAFEPRLSSNSISPRQSRFGSIFNRQNPWGEGSNSFSREPTLTLDRNHDPNEDGVEGMSPYEEAMFHMAQAEHKAKMLVLQTQRRAETAKEEAYKMIWQNAQLQRDLLQLQYENIV